MVRDYLFQMFSLEGKTAVVTGAAGGIGNAIACGLKNAGANVIFCDINTESSGEEIFYLDMADVKAFPEEAKKINATHGGIDILVNCAGINKREVITDVAEATYDAIMDINLKGAFFLSQAIAPYMKEQGGGSIINIGSHNTGASLGGVSVYASSKNGLVALTRSMAVEWAAFNIRANCVSPGHIKTALTIPTWEHPTRSKYLLERIAMNRPGVPEDLTGICIFLASQASSYITGCEYRVDGGCLCGGQPWDLN